MAEIKAAGTIVYLQEDKEPFFLLLRSAKTAEWGPPKGKAGPGETELETAVRETCEETGLRRLQIAAGFRESVSYTLEKKGVAEPKEVVYFLAHIDTDDITLSPEHTEAHLATLAEVEQLVPHENLREVFRKAVEHIRTHCS